MSSGARSGREPTLPTLAAELHFLGQRSGIVDAVVVGQSRNDISLAPVAHGPAYVLSRHASHRGKIALADLVVQLDMAAAVVLAHVLGEVKERASQSSFDTEECRGG